RHTSGTAASHTRAACADTMKSGGGPGCPGRSRRGTNERDARRPHRDRRRQLVGDGARGRRGARRSRRERGHVRATPRPARAGGGAARRARGARRHDRAGGPGAARQPDGRGIRRHRHPRQQRGRATARACRGPRAGGVRARRRAPAHPLRAADQPLPSPPRALRVRPHRADRVELRPRADRRPGPVQRRPPGRRRLGEDARPRGGTEGDHRQHRRTWPHRDRPCTRVLRGRLALARSRRGAHPAPALRYPGRDRPRRLLPRLRPRELRHRRGRAGRRRPDPLPPLRRGRRRALVWAGRAAGAPVLPAGAAFVVLWLYPSARYLLLPDKAHPLAAVVSFRNARPQTGPGSIYFLDVKERRASLLEDFFPSFRDAVASIVPASAVLAPGVSESQKIDLSQMARSQDVAAAVALRTAGYRVAIRATGALITQIGVGTPADGTLVPGEVIVSVDGRPVRTPNDARRLLSAHRPGDVVRLGVRGLEGLRTVRVRTIPDPSDRTHPIVGVLLEQSASISLPFPVRITTGDIGGSSAGLAFALEVLDKLGRDVDRGYKVAATGELFLDGSV